jgi:hypothetical protein
MKPYLFCDGASLAVKYLSMQSVMGGAQIFNPDAGIVPLTAKTSFHLDTQRNEATYLSNIDFDGDDIKDPASYLKYDETNNTYTLLEADAASEATHMGIYFTTGVETDPETNLAIPSIIRAVDRVAQHKNKGIAQNTHDDNYTQGGTFPLNGKEGAFNFQFAMRGPDDYWNAFNPYPDYAGWASATKVTEPFQKRNADKLFNASLL